MLDSNHPSNGIEIPDSPQNDPRMPAADRDLPLTLQYGGRYLGNDFRYAGKQTARSADKMPGSGRQETFDLLGLLRDALYEFTICCGQFGCPNGFVAGLR